LRHVAELAGVSQATVSRVLNGRPGVAETTRREVLRALQQLGYEPVSTGKTRRTGLVGLIVPELDNPVFPRFAQAIESLLASEGLTTMLCTSTPAGMREGDYLEVLVSHGATGIVIISGEHADSASDHRRYHDLVARGLPTVLVNGSAPGLGVATITVDHAAAARAAVAHLATLGHDRIGLAIGPRRYVPTVAFLDGYHRGLREARLQPDEGLVSETLFGIEGGHAAGSRLLAAGATGIVCASDRMALGVIRAIREAGRGLPDDVSVVGFDDAGPNDYVDTPLTSVRQPFEPMASAIVRILTGATDGTAPPDLSFRPELVVRATTGPGPSLLPRRGTVPA
jgi:LacI family transcriptional regulator, repressor for deo operon, udp, cdd, tsx, nupC, and nupG